MLCSSEQAFDTSYSSGPCLAAPGIIDIVVTCLTAEPKPVHAKQRNPIDSWTESSPCLCPTLHQQVLVAANGLGHKSCHAGRAEAGFVC